jgi:hypothetical protein
MLDVLLHTMAISGLSRVRTEFDPLLVIPSLTHHPVQMYRQSSRHRDFGGFPSSSHHQVKQIHFAEVLQRDRKTKTQSNGVPENLWRNKVFHDRRD